MDDRAIGGRGKLMGGTMSGVTILYEELFRMIFAITEEELSPR
jgi:hypothetical protein